MSGFGTPSLLRESAGSLALDVRVDASEDDTAYHVTTELPGLSEKDVEVTFADNTLTISGEKKEEKEVKEENYHRRERSFGSFRRSFTLPGEVDEAKIAATFKDGIMTIDLPKSKSAQKKAQASEVPCETRAATREDRAAARFFPLWRRWCFSGYAVHQRRSSLETSESAGCASHFQNCGNPFLRLTFVKC
ncbi:MAG: Hsp20 family protein [Kiloniellaceae bacterium]|nr:Hsp20 family protein [Kiloniellaceae bacterium]